MDGLPAKKISTVVPQQTCNLRAQLQLSPASTNDKERAGYFLRFCMSREMIVANYFSALVCKQQAAHMIACNTVLPL